MNKAETIEWIRDIIGSSMFWKDDSPYTIKDVATAIVEFIEVHPIAENKIDKLFTDNVSTLCVVDEKRENL